MEASLIIPAHNEESVIHRLLAQVCKADPPRVIVVCNGCRDRTAEVARTFPGVTVLETEVASKTNALNLGDAAAECFPRIYADADVVIDLPSLRRLVEALGRPSVLAAAPVPRLSLEQCSQAVCRFYRVDAVMPSHEGGIGGSGVYALSREGRARFGRFPEVIADDAFVRRHFEPGERVAVPESRSLVTPPSTLSGVVSIKTRSHFGNMELSHRFPQLTARRGRGNGRKLLLLSLRPWWWLAVGTYLYVKLVARVRASRQMRAVLRDGVRHRWERDESSRSPYHESAYNDDPGVPSRGSQRVDRLV